MYLGTLFCNSDTLYKKDTNRVELGDLSKVYDEDFGGWLTEDGTETGEPLYGLYAPNAYLKGQMLFAATLDELVDGVLYARVLKTDIQAGHILLSSTVGSLDDINDGSSYKKVAATSIESGKIIVAGLDSGVTERMFSSSTDKETIESWKHNSDITTIDGGKIFTGSITANKLSFTPVNSANIVATINASDEGIKIQGAKITIDGTVDFANNYDPSNKIPTGSAASDVNNGTTTINGGKITANTITTNQLNFTPVTGSNVIASINSSAEGILITGSKIQISGSTSFIDGYDPSQKVGKGTAAEDVNYYSTTINGGKITTGSITADQIATNAITADKILAGTITGDKIAANSITSLGAVTAGTFYLGGGSFQVDAAGHLTVSSMSFSNGTSIGSGGSSGEISLSGGKIISALWGGTNLEQSQINGLSTALSGKSNTGHNHTYSGDGAPSGNSDKATYYDIENGHYYINCGGSWVRVQTI